MEKELIINGQMFLYGDVGDMWGDGSGFTAEGVVKALSTMRGDIVVRLNSGGGFVTEGVAIYNALAAYRGGTLTIQVDGVAASAASLIYMAATKGKRRMGAGTVLMIHDPSGVTIGPAKDHEDTAALLHRMADNFAAIYARASGKKVEEVRQLMVDETWFTAEEAVAAGFADEVIENNSEEDATALVEPTKFDYMLYRKSPGNVKGAQRSLPTAARAAQRTEMQMTPEQIAAKAAADKLIADASAEAGTITANAKLAGAAEQATAKASADKLVADAKVAADKIVADASAAAADKAKATADVTKQILDRCVAAKLTAAQALEIIAKANGNLVAAQDAIITAVAAGASDQTHVRVQITADARDRRNTGIAKGLMARSMLFTAKDGAERNEFSGMTLKEIAREILAQSGNRTTYNDPLEMVAAAFRPTMAGPGYQSTSDFVEILANVANKSLLKGYEEAEETFQLWTSVGTLSDFRPTKRVDLNLFPALTEVPEGAEYKYGTIGERGATVTLATYGKMFAITRQAIINDDLGMFTRIPARMGRAAKRTIGNLAYAVLTTDASLSPDGLVIFSETPHANYDATGGAPNVIRLTAGIASMRVQKDPDNLATGGLNIRPAHLIVPAALEGIANVLIKAQNDPAATTPNVPNPVQGVVDVIADARLDAKSTKEWYLAANANQYDTIEVSYLNGNQNPVLEQRDGWNVDGVEFKVRLDAAVTCLDYRGLYKDNGE